MPTKPNFPREWGRRIAEFQTKPNFPERLPQRPPKAEIQTKPNSGNANQTRFPAPSCPGIRQVKNTNQTQFRSHPHRLPSAWATMSKKYNAGGDPCGERGYEIIKRRAALRRTK